MRILLSAILLGALALTGCAKKHPANAGAASGPRAGSATAAASGTAGNQSLIVTPAHSLVGKVAGVNTPGMFVVLNFPMGKMAAPGQSFSLYRGGLKVGEAKVTGPQSGDNVVADLVAGEASIGDEARSP